MNTRLITTIIICSFSIGIYTGIVFGRQFEKQAQQQKNLIFQKEVNKIG